MNNRIKAGIIVDSPSLTMDLLYDVTEENLDTPYGGVVLTTGNIENSTITLIYRLGKASKLNPAIINYRAAIWALAARHMDLIISITNVNICNSELKIGTPILFEDIFYPDNRLPDGNICTLFTEPGDPKRGRYIFEKPFAPSIRNKATAAISSLGYAFSGGVCGYFPSNRSASISESIYFSTLGLTAISPVGIPEIVLAGEMAIPSLLIGYGINYLTGILDKKVMLSEVTDYMESANMFYSEFISEFLNNLNIDEIQFDGGYIYKPHQELV